MKTRESVELDGARNGAGFAEMWRFAVGGMV